MMMEASYLARTRKGAVLILDSDWNGKKKFHLFWDALKLKYQELTNEPLERLLEFNITKFSVTSQD